MTLFIIIAGISLILLMIWVGHRLNAPEEPPEAPAMPPHGTSKYYREYVKAWRVLSKELDRNPTTQELIDYVYGLRAINELIGEEQ